MRIDDCLYTLEELAKLFGVSKNRMVQLEAKALDKLRYSGRCRSMLADFYMENLGAVGPHTWPETHGDYRPRQKPRYDYMGNWGFRINNGSGTLEFWDRECKISKI